MKRNAGKLEPLPYGYEYVDPEQAAITHLFGPSTGQYAGDPRMSLGNRPSLIPPPDNAAISFGRVRVGSPNGDIASVNEPRVGAPDVAVINPTPIYQRVFAPPPQTELQNFKAMPPFGQPGSPLGRITAAQQKTPTPPPQSAPPQPLAPAEGALGTQFGLGAANRGLARDVPAGKTA